MSDHENNPNAVLTEQSTDPETRMRAENASLRRRLAELEKSNVVNGGFSGVAPRYMLNEPGYYDDQLCGKGDVIEWWSAPNLTMCPLNDPAKRRIDEYIAELEDGARAKAFQHGRVFTGLTTDRGVLLDLANQDARSQASQPVPVIQVPQPYGEIPSMPHLPDAVAQAKRGRGRPRKLASVESAPVHGQQPQTGVDLGAPMLAPTEPSIVGRMVR